MTATRAHEQRIGFAARGVPQDQLAILDRQWPGVRVKQSGCPGGQSAHDALLSRSS